MGVLLGLLLLLALTGHSSALYCVCNSGVPDSVLQKSIDYACGAGADCTAILQNGGCYQPNTVKSHCDYAVNSYYQRKGQINGSCDFSGTAAVVSTLPTTVASTCQYQSSSSSTGTPTPSTGTGTGTGTSTGTGTGATTPSTGTGTGTTTGGTTSSTPNVFGGTVLGPTSGTGITDSGSGAYSIKATNTLYLSFMLTFIFTFLVVVMM